MRTSHPSQNLIAQPHELFNPHLLCRWTRLRLIYPDHFEGSALSEDMVPGCCISEALGSVGEAEEVSWGTSVKLFRNSIKQM